MSIKKELVRKESEYSLIVVCSNTYKTGDVIYNIVQTNKKNGIIFGNDVFGTKRKLNNYLKILGMGLL